MAEILKEWLTERLQTPINWKAEELGAKMKDGYIIACLLKSYNLINDEKHFLIRASDIEQDVKNNWKLIKEWLRDVEINLTDDDLTNIMNGKGSTLLRLFYQLFLHLDKKDRTDFIKKERKMVSSLVEKIAHRFQVTNVPEEKESIEDNLSKPLLNERHFIEWQRNKAKQVKDTYDYMRHKYSKMSRKTDNLKMPLQHSVPKSKKLSHKDKKDMEKFSLKYPCKFENFTYADLVALEEKAMERNKTLVDSDWAKKYMDNLYTRMHKKADSEEFQKQMVQAISGSLWDLSIAEEESKLDIDLAKKVMKLSQFEKQMCTQLMETKQQGRNLIKNRILAETAFADERTQQFDQYLNTLKEDIDLGLAEIDFEKKRQNILHKKLYAEKMKRKRQHYYEICYDTLLSIIDFATKYAYFKRLIGEEIPSHFIHEWKLLYYKQQPIFDILDPMEDVMKERGLEEEPASEEEEIVRLELTRQEALNDVEFLEYHNYLNPWSLDLLIPNYDSKSEERKYEYLGRRILGHLVYTLLEIKYPYPPVRASANLPIFSSKAVLRGLPDRSITVPMQKLLDARKIHIVRLESAINFCLRRFKIEMIGCKDMDISFDKFIASAQEEESKEIIRSMKAEDDAFSKSSEMMNFQALYVGPVAPNTKQTQTPKTLPEEDMTLSTPADLGRYAYETLSSGDSLTDYLIAAMIVEYIKDQEDIEGFVIINYPNSYREAQILEETFSGRSPPDEDELDDRDDIYLEESIIKHRKKEKDPYKEVRISQLLDNPHKIKNDTPFVSYFTSYLHLKETEDILQEYVIWNLTEENSEFIDRFYAVLGINYSMYYEVIEKDQLALICKYIIGDFAMPMKSDDKLFGENILSCLDFPCSDDKRTKSKIVKPESSLNIKSKLRLRRTSKASRISVSNDLEVVKAPDSVEEIRNETKSLEIVVEEESLSNKVQLEPSVENVKLLAGEEDWEFGEMPIPELIGVALASCWEEIEKNYINDMQQLFLAKRLQMNCLVPYTRFIKDKMEQIITLPSRKQDLVCYFQKEYNDFENDWRDVQLTKNEWHCRIKDLQKLLYKICDERKHFAEQQRHSLICEHWAIEELTTMANTYISCMQTELNRFFLTYQMLHDFYFTMIKRSPASDRLSSKELTKIYKDNDTTASKKSGEDKTYRHLKAAYQDLQLRNIAIDFSNNPLNMVIENNIKFALKVIKDLNDSYRSTVSREYNELAKSAPVAKKKDENNSEESKPEEMLHQNALKCVEEWVMGINGEMYRANLRMMALQFKCYQDMALFNSQIYKAFTEIQNDINNYYLNEIKSVDRLCKYLQMAVEAEKRIPETLLLEHDTFVIDPNVIQYPPPEPIVEDELKDVSNSDLSFKIGQLARLRTLFKIVAPTGIALQQALIYSLQDFIFFGKESCDGPIFPEAWKRVDPEKVPKLVFSIFGETVYVDWRDFLIYCLNIRFPTVEELLDSRKMFRCCDLTSTELINRDDMLKIKLWFENDYDIEDKYAQFRLTLIKHFLFELFETAEDVMNYSAFLLAFCKSVNPNEGFAMALSMAVGKKICYSINECEELVCKLIKEKKYRDDSLACAHKCAYRFLEKVITNVINVCEGTTITELEYTDEPSAKDKKGKKSKLVSKTKKPESNQSARNLKLVKSEISRSKLTQSQANVKSTFICGPCEEDIKDVSEKSPEQEVVEEEEKAELQEDPNLVYAVSQSTIWNILRICLPWHFQMMPEENGTPYLGQVEEVIKRLEVDTDQGDIYVSKFLVDPTICKLLRKVKKFIAVDLAEELREIIM